MADAPNIPRRRAARQRRRQRRRLRPVIEQAMTEAGDMLVRYDVSRRRVAGERLAHLLHRENAETKAAVVRTLERLDRIGLDVPCPVAARRVWDHLQELTCPEHDDVLSKAA